MKKTQIFPVFLTSFFLLFTPLSPLSAEENESEIPKVTSLPPVSNSSKKEEKREELREEKKTRGGNFEKIQENIEEALTKSIGRLQIFQEKIQNHEKIPEDKKTEYVILMGTTINQVESLKRKMAEAKNMEDLKALKGEAREFMKGQREAMKELITDIRLLLSKVDVEKMSEFVDRIEKTIKIIQRRCSSDSEDRNDLLTQINNIKTSLIAVNTAVKEQDMETAKKSLQDARTLLKSVGSQIKTMVKSCDIS